MSLAIAGYAPNWAERDARPIGHGARVPDRARDREGQTGRPPGGSAHLAIRRERGRRYPVAKVGDRFGDDFVVVALVPNLPRRSDERVEIRCEACDEPTRSVSVSVARNYAPKCRDKRARGRSR